LEKKQQQERISVFVQPSLPQHGSVGTYENSPQFQLRVKQSKGIRPSGTVDFHIISGLLKKTEMRSSHSQCLE